MKKTICLVSFLMVLFISTQSHAQITFGAKAGLNIANMSTSGTAASGETKSAIASFHVGAIADIGITKEFFIEPGILLSGKGFKDVTTIPIMQATETVTGSIKPLYIEIPINAMYVADLKTVKLQIFAGPYIGFGIGGNINLDYSSSGTLPTGYTLPASSSKAIKFGSDATTDDLKMLDFGLNFGVGVEYNNMLLRVQYGLGLTNINADTSTGSDTYKNNVIGISVGYMFGK
ncbi:MAG: porin family protein [Bacteroidota bacterium]